MLIGLHQLFRQASTRSLTALLSHDESDREIARPPEHVASYQGRMSKPKENMGLGKGCEASLATRRVAFPCASGLLLGCARRLPTQHDGPSLGLADGPAPWRRALVANDHSQSGTSDSTACGTAVGSRKSPPRNHHSPGSFLPNDQDQARPEAQGRPEAGRRERIDQAHRGERRPRRSQGREEGQALRRRPGAEGLGFRAAIGRAWCVTLPPSRITAPPPPRAPTQSAENSRKRVRGQQPCHPERSEGSTPV